MQRQLSCGVEVEGIGLVWRKRERELQSEKRESGSWPNRAIRGLAEILPFRSASSSALSLSLLSLNSHGGPLFDNAAAGLHAVADRNSRIESSPAQPSLNHHQIHPQAEARRFPQRSTSLVHVANTRAKAA